MVHLERGSFIKWGDIHSNAQWSLVRMATCPNGHSGLCHLLFCGLCSSPDLRNFQEAV